MRKHVNRIAAVGLLLAAFGAGYASANVNRAREAEYTRVVAAIARTMRCSTEEEYDAGLDHECDPIEIEQDAGLTDEQGRVIR